MKFLVGWRGLLILLVLVFGGLSKSGVNSISLEDQRKIIDWMTMLRDFKEYQAIVRENRCHCQQNDSVNCGESVSISCNVLSDCCDEIMSQTKDDVTKSDNHCVSKTHNDLSKSECVMSKNNNDLSKGDADGVSKIHDDLSKSDNNLSKSKSIVSKIDAPGSKSKGSDESLIKNAEELSKNDSSVSNSSSPVSIKMKKRKAYFRPEDFEDGNFSGDLDDDSLPNSYGTFRTAESVNHPRLRLREKEPKFNIDNVLSIQGV